jgi:2,4-dichlorophenol 6-monooxygenase
MKANMAARKADTPAAEEQRRKLRKAIAYKVYEFDCQGVEMNQRYRSSAVVPDGTPDPGFREDPELYSQQCSYPGARLPHVWIEKDRRKLSSLDICGKGRFTMLTGIGGNGWIEAARAVSAAAGLETATAAIGPGCDYDGPYGDWANACEDGAKRPRGSTARQARGLP